jgi:hypothetical protein
MNFGLITQILPSVLVFVFGLPLVIALIKNKGTLKYKNVSLSLAGRASDNPQLKKASDYLIDNLNQIRTVFFSYYLKLLKTNGCPEEILSENEDAEYFGQMLGNMVWSGNGIRSTKSIIEKELLGMRYLSEEASEMTAYVCVLIRENWLKYINDNYRTNVNYPDGTSRQRIVTNKDLYDALPPVLEGIQPIVCQIFSYAKSLYRRKGE